MEDLKKAIRPDTSLVSIMMVNNEIGVQQPVDEIGQLCRSKKIFFHTDAAQVSNLIENKFKCISNNLTFKCWSLDAAKVLNIFIILYLRL